MGNSADKLYLDKIYDTVKEIKTETGTTIPGTLADLAETSTEISGKVDQVTNDLYDINVDISSNINTISSAPVLNIDNQQSFKKVSMITSEVTPQTIINVTGSGYIYYAFVSAYGGYNIDCELTIDIDNKQIKLYGYTDNRKCGIVYKDLIRDSNISGGSYTVDGEVFFGNKSFFSEDDLPTSSTSRQDTFISYVPIRFENGINCTCRVDYDYKDPDYRCECVILYSLDN